MSLDVSLTIQEKVARQSSGIFIRRNDRIEEIPRSEWDEICPGHEPTIADFIMTTREVYSSNITHNLNKMAKAAGIYEHLWRPDEIGITNASQLIEPLENGLKNLLEDKLYFCQFNSENGWGTYDDFVRFVRDYLDACRIYPESTITISR